MTIGLLGMVRPVFAAAHRHRISVEGTDRPQATCRGIEELSARLHVLFTVQHPIFVRN